MIYMVPFHASFAVHKMLFKTYNTIPVKDLKKKQVFEFMESFTID